MSRRRFEAGARARFGLAALFEYAGQDLFEERIFPLELRQEKRVKLE